MVKRLVFGARLLLSLVVLASCASSEQAILITARASGTNPTVIETVLVRVIPTSSTVAPYNSDSNPIHRTIQEINADQPIRIAVRLHDPTPVMIHMRAITASGTTVLYATRCYDPGASVLTDEVLLVPLDPADDADGDGWPSSAHVDAACRDPGPGATGMACDIGLCPATAGADCNDAAATSMPVNCQMPMFQSMGPCVFPGAPAVCGDGVDQDCRANGLPGGSRDEPCGDMDGDGVNACGPAGGVCDCNDSSDAIHPGAVDVCGNGIDEDCSGEAGGMGAFCDADHDTYPSNVDCDDTNPNIHPGGLALEHCVMMGTACSCDGVDNNCNGLTDEDASCRSPDLDGDGVDACAAGVTDCGSCDCNDCDSGIHPGARNNVCGNGIDEDGLSGDPACDPADMDRDGFIGGTDCNDMDAHTHLDAAENCSTAGSESCGTMSCPAAVDADHDGFAAQSAGGTDCNDMDAMVNAWATETCNGVDDNCNGDADEVLDAANTGGCVTDPTCTGGSRCTVDFRTSIHHCGGCRQECNPGTTLVADACLAGACACSTNGNVACAVGQTCCVDDSMGNPVARPGCFDTETAFENCGGCGNACDATTADSCQGGRCVCGSTGAACGAGQTCCGGACVNLATDASHCGSCTRACGPRTSCNAGTCGCDDPTTHGDCMPVDIGVPGGNGCETDLLTDANFCGSCGNSCLDEHVATGTCSGGACSIGSCQPLFGDCNGGAANGCETSLSTTSNCGGCGMSCAPMHADAQCIVAGTTASCGYGTCTSPYGSCDGNVVNGCETSLRQTTTCGGCTTDCNGVVQNATASCSAAGTCDYSSACAAGTSDCDGTRANGCEPFAATHCGAGCTNCTSTVANAGGPVCSSGTCDYTGTCASGTSDCDGTRANGCEAFASTHCGAGCTNCTTSLLHATGIGCASPAGTCTFSGCQAGFLDCDVGMPGCETTQDPSHCGSTCSNCTTQVMNASTPSCSGGGTCTYATCSLGFSDCNGTRADGCERASDGTHCGGTCVDCSTGTRNVAALVCTASGTCDYTTCASGFLDCDTSRANGCEQAQDVTHCGSCSGNCTTQVLNASGRSCTSGTCNYTACTGSACDGDGNRSNGCEATQSVTACGPTCATDCTAGFQHGTAACVSSACAVATCTGSFANCDMNAANGCELSTAHSMGDCCGVACTSGQTCMGTDQTGYRCM